MTLEYRIERLRESMKKSNCDAVLILSDENRRYLSGFTGEDGNYDETSGILLITDKELILATDSRYELQAQNEALLYTVYCYKKRLAEEFPEILKLLSNKPTNLAVETSRITHELFSKIKRFIDESSFKVHLVSAEEVLKKLRIIKEQVEIEAIKQSLKIAEKAFLQLKKNLHIDMTEKEAAWTLERFIRENGADSLSFPTIAASGTNSALPHAVPKTKKFKRHEPLLFDFGAKLNGYCSDISRTIVIGEPDTTFKEVYETLYNAQKKAIESIRPEVKCCEVDKVARDYIDDSKFNGKFGHALGHGVGIAIHEPPRLSKLDNTPLQAGMVVTVEPGIYIPEWGGIRLENMIRVTEDGAEVLNSIGYDNYIIGS